MEIWRKPLSDDGKPDFRDGKPSRSDVEMEPQEPGDQDPQRGEEPGTAGDAGRVGKTPVWKKNQPSGFFYYIFAQKREFLGFFQFQEYF